MRRTWRNSFGFCLFLDVTISISFYSNSFSELVSWCDLSKLPDKIWIKYSVWNCHDLKFHTQMEKWDFPNFEVRTELFSVSFHRERQDPSCCWLATSVGGSSCRAGTEKSGRPGFEQHKETVVNSHGEKLEEFSHSKGLFFCSFALPFVVLDVLCLLLFVHSIWHIGFVAWTGKPCYSLAYFSVSIF